MPIDASPASYIPGVSLKRGSFTSDPVIPAGSAGAGCAANGFSSASGAFAVSCAGAGVCACIRLTPEHKIIAANATRKATLDTRFIVSPLRFFIQHSLHNLERVPLPGVHIRREVEQFGILPRARGVEQILHHYQRTIVVLNHPGQK